MIELADTTACDHEVRKQQPRKPPDARPVLARVIEHVLPRHVHVEGRHGGRNWRIWILIVRACDGALRICVAHVDGSVRWRDENLGVVVDALAIAHLQGSLHYTPEHCLWWCPCILVEKAMVQVVAKCIFPFSGLIRKTQLVDQKFKS